MGVGRRAARSLARSAGPTTHRCRQPPGPGREAQAQGSTWSSVEGGEGARVGGGARRQGKIEVRGKGDSAWRLADERRATRHTHAHASPHPSPLSLSLSLSPLSFILPSLILHPGHPPAALDGGGRGGGGRLRPPRHRRRATLPAIQKRPGLCLCAASSFLFTDSSAHVSGNRRFLYE